MKQENIRNFSIIAHIDHGKSTLADRLLEETGALEKRELKEQTLDSMDIERERGITIKLNAVRLKYNYQNEEYLLHLIDTPGHVDFSYEVSRSLAACEGALLVVDAAQGIEAQTLANLYLALEHDLTIIPVINKIDLPNANPEKVKQELIDAIGFDSDEFIYTSAKTGQGIKELLEAIIDRIPAPKGDKTKPLQALIFDSFFDSYRGVIISCRIKEGTLRVGDTIKLMETGAIYDVTELGVMTPKEVKKQELTAGEVGFIAASIKDITTVKVGDTVTNNNRPALTPLPGYQPMKSMVFCGIYPIESSKFEDLREALEKLKLNDASLVFDPETSTALGFGFRCGFLGLLHLEIIEERLDREFDLGLITTSPSVIYKVHKTSGEVEEIYNPTDLPIPQEISYIEEPFVTANIFTPKEYVGNIMDLCQKRRGIYIDMKYLDESRVTLIYEMPLNEIIYDFFDNLKSKTKGYASFDYEFKEYKKSDLVKLDIHINGEPVDALSFIVHKDSAYTRGKKMVEKLKTVIPRKLFTIPIQAVIGGQVIARETISAMRKDVLAKCYGGDVTRKKKLLEKQKRGKKKMREIGNVEVPQEAFLSVLKLDDE